MEILNDFQEWLKGAPIVKSLGFHGDIANIITSLFGEKSPDFELVTPVTKSISESSSKAFKRYKDKYWKYTRFNGYTGTFSHNHLEGFIKCVVKLTETDFDDSELSSKTIEKIFVTRIEDFHKLWEHIYGMTGDFDGIDGRPYISEDVVFSFYVV